MRNEPTYQSLQRLCVICYLNSIRVLRLWLEFCYKWVRLAVFWAKALTKLLCFGGWEGYLVRVNSPKLYFTSAQRPVKKRFKFKPSSKCTEEFHWGLDSLTTTEIWKTLLAVLDHTTMFLRMSELCYPVTGSVIGACEWLLYIKSIKRLPRFWIHTSG